MSETKALYRRNQQHLKKHFPNQYPILQQQHSSEYNIERESARSGTDTLKIPRDSLSGQTPFYLHSQYDPLSEAFEQIESFDMDQEESRTWFLLGMGLGYHLELLLQKTREKDLFFVFEHSPEILEQMMKSRDITNILSDPRLELFINPPPGEIYSDLREWIRPIFQRSAKIVPHPPSLKLFHAYYKEIREQLLEFIESSEGMMQTGMVLPQRTFESRIHHLQHYVKSPGIRPFQNRFEKQPGFLISAGPSLEKHIDTLPEVKKRGIVFSVGTALEKLLEHNFVPDFTGAVDYHRISKRYFDDLNPDSEDVILIADPRCAWEATREYNGPIAFYEDLVMELFMSQLELDLGHISVGATVAHQGFQFLAYCGCDPIVFLGQDLAYTYNISHVPGTAIYDEWSGELNRFMTLEMKELEHIQRMKPKWKMVEDIHGNEIVSESNLVNFIKELGHASREFPGHAIDATEGGAKIPETTQKPLSEVLKEYPIIDESFRPLADEYRQRQQQIPEKRTRILHNHLQDLQDESEDLKNKYDDIIEKLEKLLDRLDEGQPTKDLAKEILSMKKDLEKHHQLYMILSTVDQGASFLREKDDNRIENLDLSGFKKQQAQAKRNLRYIRRLKDVLTEFQNHLDPQLEKWE